MIDKLRKENSLCKGGDGGHYLDERMDGWGILPKARLADVVLPLAFAVKIEGRRIGKKQNNHLSETIVFFDKSLPKFEGIMNGNWLSPNYISICSSGQIIKRCEHFLVYKPD